MIPPMAPQRMMSRMGLTLNLQTAIKEEINSNRLRPNCMEEVEGEPKFSVFISNKAAEANKPTTD